MVDRRDFIVGATVAAGGLMLKPSLGMSPALAAPAKGGQAPGFYRTMVGNIQVTSLLDGGTEFANDLFADAKPETLSGAKKDNFLDEAKPFPGYVNGFLINTGSRLILVDTGARGSGPNVGRLINNLASAGVRPDDIDDVIITHAHPDHAGGLLDEGGMRIFPRSNLRISREDMDFWYNETARKSLPKKVQMFDMAQKLLSPYRNSGQIKTFRLGEDIGNGISSVNLAGHTPGHSGIRVSDGSNQLLIWADVVHVPALQFAHPEQSIGYDIDPEAAKATRQKIFDEVATDRIRVAGMHLCFPAIGHVAKMSSGYDFVPQMFETTI